jgi:gluconokinase
MATPPAVIVIMGVSGAGKSTVGSLLAQTLGWQFADADDFHPAANVQKMSHGLALTDDDRLPWLDAMAAAMHNWLVENRKVVLACSALKRSYRQALLIDPERIAFVYLKATYDELERRLKLRKHHFMKGDLLSSQLSTLEEPQGALTLDASESPPVLVRQIIEQYNLDQA